MENAAAANAIRLDRGPSERALGMLVWMVAIGAWIFLALSPIGIASAIALGLVFFLAHLAFAAHLRGSAVRSSGGALDALATQFPGTNMIVLYSDLLEACGNDEPARDFGIAHEHGHLHAGHLRWHWFLTPGLAIPFRGHASSRARESTCDRYGIAASTDRARALDGLGVLAAGGMHAKLVHRRARVAQRSYLESVPMRLGRWLFTHRSIAHRLAAPRQRVGPGRCCRRTRGGAARPASQEVRA